MALPGIYRPSLRIHRNKAKKRRALPETANEKATIIKQPKANNKNQKEVKRRGGTVTKACSTANEFLGVKA